MDPAVLIEQVIEREARPHGRSRQPSREKAFGKRRALTTQSADAAKSVDIIVSDRAASGGIDRLGGGTRPTALPDKWVGVIRIASGLTPEMHF